MTKNSLYDRKNMQLHMQPEVEAYYFREWKGFKMPCQHVHDRIEIMYVIKGSCRVEIFDVSIKLKNSSYILIDAGVPHRLLVEEDEACRMLNMEFVFTEKQIAGFPSVKEFMDCEGVLKDLFEHAEPYIVQKDVDEVYPAMKRLVMELDTKHEQSGLLKQLLLVQILIDISRRLSESDDEADAGMVYAKKAVNHMNIYYDSDLKVRDIAAAVNIHPGYLHRIFKNHMGTTVMNYLAKLRMEKAKMFLSNTSESIIDISGYVGLNSRQYFSFLFKKHTGMTPLEYRKDSLGRPLKRS